VDLKTFRRDWSADHKRLRSYLSSGDQIQSAKDLFCNLHGVMHSGELSGGGSWSYADLIFNDLTEKQLRWIPENSEHSLIWILWHISRIEDITMNILVENGPQVYLSGNWGERLNSPIQHSGNLILDDDLRAISDEIEIDQLFKYRLAVGQRTQEIVSKLSAEELALKVPSDRLSRIMEEGALHPEADVLIEYWSRKKIYQLLLMPPTRHLMVHLNEARALKVVVLKSA
jgi:hypothetical protein